MTDENKTEEAAKEYAKKEYEKDSWRLIDAESFKAGAAWARAQEKRGRQFWIRKEFQSEASHHAEVWDTPTSDRSFILVREVIEGEE